MNIVVLDAKPLNPGDLDWSPLGEQGVLTLHDNTQPEELLERVKEANVLFSNKVKLPRAAFEAAPNLKLIGVLATGYDIVDLEAAHDHNVTVCNVPSYSAAFTAQSTWALILELTHHVGEHNWAVKNGVWSHQEYFSFWNFPLIELDGKTLLIVGLGSIGRRVAQIGRAMGMRILAAKLSGREASGDGEFEYVELGEGLEIADVVSLHCPATEQTCGLVDAEFLKKMKPSAILVNASRGALVVEEELAAALEANTIAGYAADVLSSEPPSEENPLLGAKNCIITPHLAWASIVCRQRILETSAQNLRAFLNGKPQNVVSQK